MSQPTNKSHEQLEKLKQYVDFNKINSYFGIDLRDSTAVLPSGNSPICAWMLRTIIQNGNCKVASDGGEIYDLVDHPMVSMNIVRTNDYIDELSYEGSTSELTDAILKFGFDGIQTICEREVSPSKPAIEAMKSVQIAINTRRGRANFKYNHNGKHIIGYKGSSVVDAGIAVLISDLVVENGITKCTLRTMYDGHSRGYYDIV